MSFIAHIETLRNKHGKLEEEIHQAEIHHLPMQEIKALKKQKLKIKDEIVALLSKKSDEEIDVAKAA